MLQVNQVMTDRNNEKKEFEKKESVILKVGKNVTA